MYVLLLRIKTVEQTRKDFLMKLAIYRLKNVQDFDENSIPLNDTHN